MFKNNPICKSCGKYGHFAMQCYNRRHKSLAPESKNTKKKRLATRRAWFKDNPADENGNWECYLQISSQCPVKLTYLTITLEHVQAKVRAPQLKYDPTNIRPSCSYCNKLKGSRSLEELAKIFPQVRIMLDTQSLHVI